MRAQNTIAYNMTKTVVIFTLLIGLFLGTIQVIWDYQQRVDNLNNRVEEVLKSIEKAAVKAVYTFDTDLAAEVASGLFEFPPISSVSIKDENDKIMTNMIRYPGELPYYEITQFLFQDRYRFYVPLKLVRQSNEIIGGLQIEVAPHDTVEAFLNRSITIFSAAFLESFLISAILLFWFFKRVTRPLHLLANDFTKIDPQAPEKSNLSIDPSLMSSEFEELIQTGNNMLSVIGSQLRAKDLAEAELKKQKNETERYLKIAEAIILQLDKSGKVVMINQRGLDVMGYRNSEVLGKDWFDLAIAKEDGKTLKKVFSDLINSTSQASSSSYFENDILTKDGKARRIFWHHSLERDQFGEPVGILSSGQDVTARKEAEKALRETEGSLRAIIEATSEGFAITELETKKLLDVNSSFYEMLGYSRNEMVNQPLEKFVCEEDLPVLYTNVMAAKSKPHRSYEISLKRRDGQTLAVEINASNLPKVQDEVPRSVAFITNITDRKEREKSQKRLEQQLRQAQKMETIGTLAGGIAHDFNNILTPILGYSSILSSRINEDDPNHARIEQIAKSAKRAAEMVKQILTFSRRSEGELVSSYLTPVISEALTLVRSTTPSNIEVRQNLPEDCAPVIADATQIQQLILNLCTNANHAMAQEGGILEVRLEERRLDEGSETVSAVLKPGKYLTLIISDTGQGMDDETMHRIFDPFYTTKKSGEGTGLGLAMAHGIVQNHGGDILVESALNKGTTFTVYLPTSELPVSEHAETPAIIQGNQERALVVDDEVMNTEFISELLNEAGYEYDCFNDSVYALDAFMDDPDKYKIVLTDQTMPKLSGDQLVKAIREVQPDMPIIMMSGYDPNINIDNAEEFGVDIYLQKPVSIEALTGAMDHLLHSTDIVR